MIYRYADVLLKKAEALNEMGRPDQAAVPLNIVRKRAGLPEVSGLSQETMREKIIHERRMELAFEGHRWFDMIRVNNGEYAIKFLHSIGKSNVNKNRLLFPIPQTEMDANTLMVQNPGYMISTLSGKIGRLNGVSTKTAYSNIITKAGE